MAGFGIAVQYYWYEALPCSRLEEDHRGPTLIVSHLLWPYRMMWIWEDLL